VYGSGFGTAPGDGFFRIVYLAPLEELASVFDEMEAFTAGFLST
jgi:aspartate/methionine/tyrosine aminotransferase